GGARPGVGRVTGRGQAPDSGGRTHPERQRGKRDTGERDSTPAEQVRRRRPGRRRLGREPEVRENLPDHDGVFDGAGARGCGDPGRSDRGAPAPPRTRRGADGPRIVGDRSKHWRPRAQGAVPRTTTGTSAPRPELRLQRTKRGTQPAWGLEMSGEV